MAESKDFIEIKTKDIENKAKDCFFDLLKVAGVKVIDFGMLSKIRQVDENPIFPSYIANLETEEGNSEVYFRGFSFDLDNEENLKTIVESTARIQEIYQHIESQKFLGIIIEFGKSILYLVYSKQPEGESLEKFMKNEEFDSQKQKILQMLLRLVIENHSKNVFHLDIRPDNILIQALNGIVNKVVLVNYGLRKLISLASSQVTSVIFNCSLYQPPECFSQAQEKVDEETIKEEEENNRHSLFSLKSKMIHHHSIDENENTKDESKIDVWSLGCLISHFYSDQPPWHQCKNYLKLEYYLSIKKPFVIPKTVSQPIKEIVEACTQILPSSRPSTLEILSKLEII